MTTTHTPEIDYMRLVAQRNEEKAKEIALELRNGGMRYNDIAERLGGLYRPGLIKQWCVEWEQNAPAPIEALPNSTIMGLFGGKGSGKSLSAGALAFEYYSEGIPVFYNPRGLLRFPPTPGGVCEFASLRDIILRAEQLRNCLIVLDEMQVNLSKYRTSTKASVLIRGVIQQVRKLGMDIVVTSNSPNQIDAGFAEQLDFHGMCRAHLPPDDPRDYVDIHWCDTQGFYGKGTPTSVNGRRFDTRMRFGEIVWPASDIFPLYDHSVQVDPLEVMGLTAEEVLAAKEEKEIGLNVNDMKLFVINDLVPHLVRTASATSIVPTLAVDMIRTVFPKGFNHTQCCRGISTQETSEYGCKDGELIPFVVSPELLGKALTAAGLQRRGRSQAYVLPDLDQLGRWQAGIWAPGDE